MTLNTLLSLLLVGVFVLFGGFVTSLKQSLLTAFGDAACHVTVGQSNLILIAPEFRSLRIGGT